MIICEKCNDNTQDAQKVLGDMGFIPFAQFEAAGMIVLNKECSVCGDAIGPRSEEKINMNPSLEDRVRNLEYNLRFLMDALCKMFPLNNELERKLREAMDRGGGIQNFPSKNIGIVTS